MKTVFRAGAIALAFVALSGCSNPFATPVAPTSSPVAPVASPAATASPATATGSCPSGVQQAICNLANFTVSDATSAYNLAMNAPGGPDLAAATCYKDLIGLIPSIQTAFSAGGLTGYESVRILIAGSGKGVQDCQFLTQFQLPSLPVLLP